MKRSNKLIALFLVLALSVAVFTTGCGSAATTAAPATTTADAGSESTTAAPAGQTLKVGIAMPTKSSARWIADGDNMVKVLQSLGYETDLQYAEDVIENQVSQIENMITTGANALVIAAIDGEALGQVLTKANEAGIPVIAYDRLIRGSEFVSYYATFDNFKVGVQQATTLVKGLKLDAGEKALSTLNCLPVPRTTTMPISSLMVPCLFCSLTSIPVPLLSRAARPNLTRLPPCVGMVPPLRLAWTIF